MAKTIVNGAGDSKLARIKKLEEELKRLKSETREVCPECGATKPWHFDGCMMAMGLACPECKAFWPRHYDHCTRDTIKFGRWFIAKDVQKELVELYRTELAAAKAEGRYKQPPPIEEEPPPVPNEQMVNPVKGRQITKAIMFMLQAPSKEIMLERKQAILEEVDKL